MKTRTSFFVRLAAVLTSMALLAAYVVCSQVEQTRSFAPGSKSMALDPVRKGWPESFPQSTGSSMAPQTSKVAHGSNEMATSSSLVPAKSSQSVSASSSMLMSSSKSGRAFDSQSLVPKLPEPKVLFTNELKPRLPTSYSTERAALTNAAILPNYPQ